MRTRYFTPLVAFIVPSLVIGFGVVIQAAASPV
jgi:hypothetical protein